MNFLYPAFLWALLAIAIPIIIHLFYFRRYKTIYFTNVHFLKEVKEQTSSSQRIRNLLVLLSRILVVVFLVFAFAQPYIAKKGGNIKDGAKDVSIFFDNSFSMSAESDEIRLLEKARKRAEEIIAAYSANDQIQILTSDFEGRDQRMLSKEDALSRVREVQSSYNTKPMSKVLRRQRQALASGNNKHKEIYIISDFQQNAMDLETYEDTAISMNLVPLQSIKNRNVVIDTAWFLSPVQALNQSNALVVKVRNLGEVEMPNVRLSLTLNGELRPIGSLTLPANTAVTDTINVTVSKTGWYEAKLNITDFPIEFDNNYYFTFYVKEKVDILEIHEGSPNKFIQASFDGNDYFEATQQAVGQLDYSRLSNYDLVILSELKSIASGLVAELKTFVENGGNLVVFPHAEAQIAQYNKLNKVFNANTINIFEPKTRKVAFINLEEFVFFDVFEERRANLKLPQSTANFKINKRATAREEVLLRYRDGGTFLSKYPFKKGNYYFSAVPLDVEYSDLVKNGEIFVPMLYRMALATGQEQKIAYTIGQDNILESTNQSSTSEMVYKIGGATGEFIPEQRRIGSRLILGMNNQIKLAGFYNLYFKAEKTLDKFGFNFDRKESDLSFYSAADLKKIMGDLVSIIDGTKTQNFKAKIDLEKNSTPLWKYCLILTLLFLLIETLLIRIWRKK